MILLDSAGAWLSPVELAREVSNESPAPPQRASNRGCLPISQSDYLQLLDLWGRSLRAAKQGRIRPDVPEILDCLAVSPEGWLSLVSDFSRLFRRAAGTESSPARDVYCRRA